MVTSAGALSPLRTWRVAKGLTLDEIHGLTGLSVAMISRVERGERKLAPMTKVQVARRLGASVADLFPVDGAADVEVA